jgi:hypothetical protein
MFPRRPATKILAAHQNIPSLHPRNKRGINIFHGMFRQLGVIVRIQITRRNNLVSIDMRPWIYVRAPSNYTPLV